MVGRVPRGDADLDCARSSPSDMLEGDSVEGRLDPARQRPRDGARRRAGDGPRAPLDPALGHAGAAARARAVERRARPLRRHPRPRRRSRRSPSGPVSAAGAAGRAAAGRCRRRCSLLGLLFLVALAAHERYAGRLALPRRRGGGRRESRLRRCACRASCCSWSRGVPASSSPSSSPSSPSTSRGGATTLPADDVRFASGAADDRSGARGRCAPLRAGKRCSTSRTTSPSAGCCSTLRASKLHDCDRLRSDAGGPPDRRTPSGSSRSRQRPRSRAAARAPRTCSACVSIAAWNSTPPQGTSGQDRSELLLNAIASFEQAIALDPDNDDAKYNLQLMLARGQGLLPTEASAGRNPLSGRPGLPRRRRRRARQRLLDGRDRC